MSNRDSDRYVWLHVELDDNGEPFLADQHGRKLSGERGLNIDCNWEANLSTATVNIILIRPDGHPLSATGRHQKGGGDGR